MALSLVVPLCSVRTTGRCIKVRTFERQTCLLKCAHPLLSAQLWLTAGRVMNLGRVVTAGSLAEA